MEAHVSHRLHGELPEAGAHHGRVVDPVGVRRGGRLDCISMSSSLHTPQESPNKKSNFQKLYVSKSEI